MGILARQLTAMIDFGEDISNYSGSSYEFTDVVKIVDVIANKKASFKSEIAGIKGLDRDTVGKILHKLEEEGILERLNPKFKHSDQRLLSQRSRPNLNSIDEFKNCKWFALNSDLQWVLKIRESCDTEYEYMDEYHRPLELGDEKMDQKFQELISSKMDVV